MERPVSQKLEILMSTSTNQDQPAWAKDYAIREVFKASLRLANGDRSMSRHEYAAAAIINGRTDFLVGDYRVALVEMGRDYAHAVIEAIFDNWEREMTLPADHPAAPIGDQCMTGAATS